MIDEPLSSEHHRPPLQVWWRMTRPAFLLLTVVACVLGTASAAACGCGLDMPLALGATTLAVIAHALGNVLNDLHDARNGADVANTRGVFPFSGGSRMIQRGEVSERQTRELALALLMLLIPGGLLLAVKVGPGILLLGLAGVLFAWAYSAPPFKLMSRGLGELTVALVWFGVVIGADYVQRRQFFVIPASAAASFALMVAALLVINGVPDAQADAQVGKRTLVVRLGTPAAVALYGGLVVMAHAWLGLSVWLLIPPVPVLWGLVSLPLSLAAWVSLMRNAYRPEGLKPALALTVAATLLHGLVVMAHAWLALSVWLLIPPMPVLWGLVSFPLSLAAWVSLKHNANQPERLKPALALTVAATLLHGLGMAWGFAQLARLH